MHLGAVVLALMATGIAASAFAWDPRLTLAAMQAGLLDPPEGNFAAVLFHYGTLPRIAAALAAGATLGLSGAVMQAVLRNPLASPTTLGVAAGGQFALVLSTLYAPAVAFMPAEVWTFLGGLGATAIVYLIGRRHGFAPAYLALAGMALTLLLSAAGAAFVLFNEQRLAFIFLWGAGHLAQSDWTGARVLAVTFALGLVTCLAATRAIRLLSVGDNVAKGLGLATDAARVLTLLVAVTLTAVVVARVGLVGFIGLAVPAIARLCRLRSVQGHLVGSAFLGAAALFAADALAQLVSGSAGSLVPAGAVTALFGAPILFWLLARSRLATDARPHANRAAGAFADIMPQRLFALAAGVIVVACLAALVGRTGEGWSIVGLDADPVLLAARLPRVFGAALAGAAIALSGLLIQKIVGNDLASPELLGISNGAAAAVVGAALLLGEVSRPILIAAGFLGALLAAAIVLMFAQRHRNRIAGLLLAGIALSVFLDALVRIALANASLQSAALLTWMSGTTLLISTTDVAGLALLLAVLTAIVLPLDRAVALQELGAAIGRSLGMKSGLARASLLTLAAFLASAATVVVGPLSFVGLIAPHLARSIGGRRFVPLALASMLIGALVMAGADWIGRTIMFPWQMPAGLVAGVIGGVTFIVLTWRRRVAGVS